MGKEKTGGVRLEKMIRHGQINKPYLWIDTYNQITSDIAGTIMVGVDFRNQFYVSVYGEYKVRETAEKR